MPTFARKLPYVLAATIIGLLLIRTANSTSDPANQPALAQPAPSQRDTVADGQIRSDADGLQLDEGLIRLFDYHLAALGEQTLDQITHHIERDLASKLSPKAAANAQRLLKQYLAYKTALIALDKDASLQGDQLAVLERRLNAQRALRLTFFSVHENQALFGWQDRFDTDALARQKVQQNAALSAAQKLAQLTELDRQLPPEMLAARQAPVQHLALNDSVTAARQRGASDTEIYHLRAMNVGDEAATRLATLDKEEADWQARIKAYLADVAIIRSQTGLDEAARNKAIIQLRQSRFNETEQLRLVAYEPK